jgi:epoxide hydrolase 4
MAYYPGLADRLAILNVPHPARFAAGLRTPRQLLKSWYIFAFQLPLVADLCFAALGGALIRRVFSTDPDHPLEPWELDRYAEAAAGPGGMTGAIHWYRAAGAGLWPANMPALPPALLAAIQAAQGVAAPPPPPRARAAAVGCPVLVLWGERDRYLGAELARPPAEAAPDCRLHYLDASHWVHWDRPDEVTARLLAFAQEPAGARPGPR